MITQNKLDTYIQCNGDVDMWARSRRKRTKEWEEMSSSDWFLIQDLLQSIAIVKSGQASSQFRDNLNEQILEECDNEDTIKKLIKILQ